ncbi:MAG: carboxypeptidase regulatory-like domain-containing protein, partial [Acidobacteriota bacterium]|nr:carboxypeptidase regulatory-like domain-containing protein [Acidobacteriota bacterium]
LLYQTQLNRISLVTPERSLPIFYSAPTAAALNALTYGLCPANAPAAAPTCLTVGGNQASLNNPLAQYGYTSTITGYVPTGNSNYNGLATELTRRFSNGLLFKGAYTWSHLIDDSTAEVNSTTLSPRRPQDFRNNSAEKASSALDRRQRFTMTTLYELPWFNKSGNWMMKNVVGNWEVSGVYTYETPEYGDPQSALDANLNGDTAGDRAVINVNGIPGTSSDVTALKNTAGATVGYLANNPNAQYIRAQLGVYANSGRNLLPTRPIDNLDFTFVKSFSFRERTKFQFRADFLNGLNHPQYTPGYPNVVTLLQHIGQTNFLTPGNPLFGQFDQVFSSNPRNIQVGAKITF